MFSHTFHYDDIDDFMSQMQSLLTKLGNARMTPYPDVMERYPHLSAAAFCLRLKRFKGEFPKEMSPTGTRTVKLFVTPELHEHLSKI